jgi:hypothetical protein
MRSLSQYMLDPELKWIGAIDGHYHDQAQFVRDFRRFMGMTPRAYVAHPRPVLSAVMRARFEAAGAACRRCTCRRGPGTDATGRCVSPFDSAPFGASGTGDGTA